MFDTSNFKEIKGKNYIRPGVSEVTIVEVTHDDKEDKFLNFKLKNKGEEDDLSTDFRLYFNSDKAKHFSGSKLSAILNATLSAEQASFPADTLKELASKCNPLMKGKSFRCKFTAQEYVKADGVTIGLRPQLPVSDFAESITDGTSSPKVEKTNMTYSESNPYDVTRLPDDKRPVSEESDSEETKSW